MKSMLTRRLTKLEAGDPLRVRFILAGELARGELPKPGAFTFRLDSPQDEWEEGVDRAEAKA